MAQKLTTFKWYHFKEEDNMQESFWSESKDFFKWTKEKFLERYFLELNV
jgi:hypothetical protein